MRDLLKKIKKLVINIVALSLFFALFVGLDEAMNYEDNPITLTLILVFWIWFAYLLIPSFIIKYRKLIVLYFVPLLLIFTYIRLFSDNFDAYKEVRENSFLMPLLIPIPIFLGIALWIYEQWKWIQDLKTGKHKAELSLLRSQINPHFFFNTLNNLYALTIAKSDQAPEVILKLSDMMRYTIYEGEKDSVKLLDEITYLNNYIELHKIRYKKSVEISFKHSVDTSLTVAPLLFILLLENAFKHGIESLAENAFIHINLYEESNFICFDIENNFDANDKKESTGIGLENLQKRLSLLYKEKHEYAVEVTNNVYKTKLKISKNA